MSGHFRVWGSSSGGCLYNCLTEAIRSFVFTGYILFKWIDTIAYI